SDLEILRENNISEGVYIEYKSDFPNNTKIAHSIASFANMYGGWYFIGVKTDDDNVPNDFLGFKLSKHPNPKETIRNIALSHINPFPLFDSKLIKVDDERGILAVLIHESIEPPHITKDGRIYRRNGEGGDPVAENDRYAIDRLYDRSKRFKGIVENFCQNKIVIPNGQAQQGWLEIYLMTYPLGKLLIDNFLRKEYIDSVKSLLDRQSTIPSLNEFFGDGTGNIPFNNVATSSNSIIFRQTTPDNLVYLTPTFEFYP
ncbi:MAG: ATP-binding protein, partial [Methanophagales archaeon]|nr:ATP-binding protein [Methanophagales archaeon]